VLSALHIFGHKGCFNNTIWDYLLYMDIEEKRRASTTFEFLRQYPGLMESSKGGQNLGQGRDYFKGLSSKASENE
jgi:hypothetical protein